MSTKIERLLTKAQKHEDNIAAAVYAAGCFWGVEYHLQKMPGVIATQVGYIGGNRDNPNYEQVCTGTTGHAEAVLVLYDTLSTDFETLTKLFFEIHNPEQRDGQGPDIGTQYRSAIYYFNNEQYQIADKLINELKEQGVDVTTELLPAEPFWPAEDHHQDYYEKHQKEPYCHRRIKRW